MEKDDITSSLNKMNLNSASDDFDIIKKPRTNFTNNVLRRAIPKMNIQDKISSISMNKLNVLSAMRLGPTAGSSVSFNDNKIKTVGNLPKIHSLDSRMMGDILPDKKKDKKEERSTGQISKPVQGLAGIEEGKMGDEDLDDVSEKSEEVFNKQKPKGADEDDSSGKVDSDDNSDSGESSIDMDGDEDDEQKLYAQILSEQNKAATLKDAKIKGEHLDDLVDKEMIELL
jgi:hypothetical protein